MKRRSIRLLATGIVILLMISSLSACEGSSKKANKLLTEFEHACNTLDIDAMHNCIVPAVAGPVRASLSLFGFLAQKGTDEVFGQMAGLLSGNSNLNGNEFFSSEEIESKRVKISGKTLQAGASLSYRLIGQTCKKDALFVFKKSNDKWYIAGFKFI